MSHLHIPDGLLPAWLWITGIVLAVLLVFTAIFMRRGSELKKDVPILGMMSAMMLVGMNLEIVPIAYHVNLSVITGILLGPWLGIITAFIVNIILSLTGHGGITVVGLNTLVIGSETVLGWMIFRLVRRFMRPGFAAGISTVVTLFVSTCVMLGIVALANLDLSAATLHEVHDILSSNLAMKIGPALHIDPGFDFRFFATVALGAGAVGWTIESLVTAVAVKFIARVKPEMLR